MVFHEKFFVFEFEADSEEAEEEEAETVAVDDQFRHGRLEGRRRRREV